MMSMLLLLAASPFVFEDLGNGSLALKENGAIVFVYHYGEQLPPGVPEDRRRCCYLHPVNSPQGVTVTDDFPKDHYHHRGMFWAWQVVRVDGKQYDLWTLKGMAPSFQRWLRRDSRASEAVLAFEQSWNIAGRPVIRETVEITTHRADPHREIDVQLTLEALHQPVAVAGAPDQNKGYSGFSVRFAPRTETRITTDRGELHGDEDHGPHPWAEFGGLYRKGRASLRIEAGQPIDWTLRQYGFLGATFPGLTPYTLHPGKPLTLRYRVVLQDR